MDPATPSQMEQESPRETIEPDGALRLHPPRRRRRRRRRRSSLRRLIDGLIPFAVLIGLGVLAAGMVGVVERGAASASSANDDTPVYPMRQVVPEGMAPPDPEHQITLDKESVEPDLETESRPSLVAYQVQSRLEAELGFLPPSIKETEVSLDDVLDWGLIEETEALKTSRQ